MMIQKRGVIFCVVFLTFVCVNSETILEHTENDEQVCKLKSDNLCSNGRDEGSTSNAAYNIRVYTIASEKPDGFQRFNRSARIYGIKVSNMNRNCIRVNRNYLNAPQYETLGMENDWNDEDSIYSDGGYKLNILKRAIKNIKDDADTLILYTDR